MKIIKLNSFKNSMVLLLIIALCVSMISMNLTSTFGTPSRSIVINEVELNPPGTDFDNEWIELYNPTPSTIDLTGWRIYTSTGRVYEIPRYTIIAPDSYIIISFRAVFLSNTNEYIILKDSTGAIVDQTPTISDTANNEYTWQRYPNSKDTDSSNDWQFRPMTKGFNNGGESISLNLSSSSIIIGSSVNVYGNINPAHFALITIQYMHGGGSWINLTTTTTYDGNFAIDWKPSEVGTYSLRALLWDGITSNIKALTVNKIPTSLTCMASSSKITLGKSISILGFISPKISIPLTLTLNAPNGSVLVKSTSTDENGVFNYTFVPDATGTWYGKVSWNGDESHEGSESDQAYFEVSPRTADAGFATIFIPLAIIPGILALALLFSKVKPSAPPKGIVRPRPIKLQKPKKPLLPLRKPRLIQKPQVPVCPRCKKQLTFIPQTRRWYCTNCRRYF